VFNTRSRPEHTRKRKIVSHVFSQKHVLEFEPNVHSAILELTAQWDKLAEYGAKGETPNAGAGDWEAREGRVWFDCLPCKELLALLEKLH